MSRSCERQSQRYFETMRVTQRLTPQLAGLEAEAIGILREGAAAFRRPVLLYSIGKDSSVLLHLAMKACFPGKPPFPLLPVDTIRKFKEMIRFRESIAQRLGLELLVHTNQEGLARGIILSHRDRRSIRRR